MELVQKHSLGSLVSKLLEAAQARGPQPGTLLQGILWGGGALENHPSVFIRVIFFLIISESKYSKQW